MDIKLNNKYKLTQYKPEKNDDLKKFFKKKKYIYITDFYHPFSRTEKNLFKKKMIYEKLSKNSLIYSYHKLQDVNLKITKHKNIRYFYSAFKNNRLFQSSIFFQILFKIIKEKNKNILLYNFDFPFCFFIFLRFFNYNIVFDIEDDYFQIKETNFIKKFFTGFSYKYLFDNCIVINKYIKKNLNKNCRSLFYFGDFNPKYKIKKLEIKKKNLKIVTGGTLSKSRGFNLISDIIKIFDEKKLNYHLFVTGEGKYKNHVKHKKVSYVGYLSDHDYKSLMKKTDLFVVPQPPDTTFSKATYPSKILEYSYFNKPILVLKNV